MRNRPSVFLQGTLHRVVVNVFCWHRKPEVVELLLPVYSGYCCF